MEPLLCRVQTLEDDFAHGAPARVGANGIPAAIGPGLAGLILDNYNPNLLWYVGAALCAVAALCYYRLHLYMTEKRRFAAQAKPETAAA